MTIQDTLAPLVSRSLRESARVKSALLSEALPSIVQACETVVEAIRKGNKVLFLGNGGSAADAQHLAAEFVGRFVAERRALPALALTVDTSALTCIGNDYGFEFVFSRQIEALGQPGDVLVAITTSGTSPNVVRALEAARQKGLRIVGLTGQKGLAFAKTCDVAVVVPSRVTARVQECHIAVGHVLCEAVDASLLEDSDATSKETSGAMPSKPFSKVTTLENLTPLRAAWKASGVRVVWTSGVFDVLHVGHVTSLKAARALGDVLVVGVNADESVKKLKGDSRPVFPAFERAEMLAALEFVDAVVVFEESTPERALSILQPDIHCKGEDYKPPHGAPIPEAKTVEAYGGRIEFLPFVKNRSTTSTLARLVTGESSS